MSVTVVNQWTFLDANRIAPGMEAIREYMAYLTNHDTGLEQSLWLRDREDSLRYYHIATYRTFEHLERQFHSDGTNRFVERLYPLIDEDSVNRPVGDVVANTGAGPGEV